MDRAGLRQAVYDRVGVDTTDQLVTANVVNRFVNAALHLISAEHDWPWLKATDTVTTVDGTGEYDMPADFLRGRQVRIDGEDPMGRYDKSDLDQRWPSSESRGKPYDWTIEGQLILRPIPDNVYTVVVDYIREEPELLNDSDEPLMPATFHDAIVERATVLTFRRTGNLERAQAALLEYAEWKKVMVTGDTRRFTGPGRIRIRPGSFL